MTKTRAIIRWVLVELSAPDARLEHQLGADADVAASKRSSARDRRSRWAPGIIPVIRFQNCAQLATAAPFAAQYEDCTHRKSSITVVSARRWK